MKILATRKNRRSTSQGLFKKPVITLSMTMLFSLSSCVIMPSDIPEQSEKPTFHEVSDLPEPPQQVDPIRARASELLGSMTEEQKISALFVVAPEDIADESPVTESAQLESPLSRYPVSGICWFSQNLENPEQTRRLLDGASSSVAAVGGTRLFDCVDEEGGSVLRVAGDPDFGLSKPGAVRDLGGNKESARRQGEQIGDYLSQLGFEVDFAPVCDVTGDPDDVMYTRVFSSSPEIVGECAAAELDGLREKGVSGCLKHFPGIGGASGGDSHIGEIELYGTEQELLAGATSAFDVATKATPVPMIMVGHASCTSVDGHTPACLSHKVVTKMLREDLGYNGIIITDSLQMGAITNRYSAGEAAVEALAAGCDLLLMPSNFDEAREAVASAVANGRLSWEAIDNSLLRILSFKISLGIA